MMHQKLEQLQRLVSETGSLLVAFSGGVDSAFLLAVARNVLGERAAAITVDTPFHSRCEIDGADRLAAALGVRHLKIKIPWDALPELVNNPPERCYICKKAVFKRCLKVCSDQGFSVLADGSNLDDLDDYRPGRAALRELGVRSPLLESGLTKQEIRQLSREMGLETWDKPALACLMTRLPHGETVTVEHLRRIEVCEDFLRTSGFGQLRVRSHDDTARIEVEQGQIEQLCTPEMRERISTRFRSAGFSRVTVDLGGYRCGSMNPGSP